MSLQLKVPPLLVLAVAILLLLTLPSWSPALPNGLAIGALLMIAATAIAVTAVLQFRQQQTTVDPRDPNQTTSLVNGGIYRFSRNPMYLAFALTIGALSLWLDKVDAGLLLLVGFIAYLNQFQIAPEERLLEKQFGQQYRDYCKQVRRWL